MSQQEKINTKEHSLILVMNSWYKEIPEEERNIIIATALNDSSFNKCFNITGYLITNRRLFLIGFSEETPFNDVLNHFYHQVSIGILEYKKRIHTYKHDDILDSKSDYQLFTEELFHDDYTRKLITGKKVNLAYYDASLARLKDYIHNYNYCSAIDYAGGQSRVIVATESEE